MMTAPSARLTLIADLQRATNAELRAGIRRDRWFVAMVVAAVTAFNVALGAAAILLMR